MRLGDSISSQAGANNPFLALELNGKQRDVSERIKTAKALGLTVPNSMQLLADEVTEQRSFVHAHCYTCPGLLLAAHQVSSWQHKCVCRLALITAALK